MCVCVFDHASVYVDLSVLNTVCVLLNVSDEEGIILTPLVIQTVNLYTGL